MIKTLIEDKSNPQQTLEMVTAYGRDYTTAHSMIKQSGYDGGCFY